MQKQYFITHIPILRVGVMSISFYVYVNGDIDIGPCLPGVFLNPLEFEFINDGSSRTPYIHKSEDSLERMDQKT